VSAQDPQRTEHVCSARRIVVKVGTNVLAGSACPLDDDRVGHIVDQIADLRGSGRQIALVTSGAIGCGMAELGLGTRPRNLPESQAAASVGQGALMACYARHFRAHGLHAAQILLTHEDFDDRERYLNASNTIHALFEMPCVPVINENDSISTAEIRFGDNDRLAALVTHLVRAQLLVLLTSVPGLYATPPGPDGQAQIVDVVERIDESVEQLAYDETAPLGVGGMRSKIQAARVATAAGEAAVIADGRKRDVLLRLMAGETLGTLFLPARGRLRRHKRWIRFTSRPRGTVYVDPGARAALVERGKSLLASGIVRASGQFGRGDVIRVCDAGGQEFARGLSNYAHDEVERIRGRRSEQIEAILGYKYYDEVIHRDNLALLL
jgi:glutamate 5-kinase